ncbi:peptidylprolyl isomerase [Anatilimnocola sp. NA78]|uniref:peptidylprolyl isomerase n=1 Tax=Anatilimnocola sp. NA78 TaxID=3415683 RepID=UPI003CE50B18
MTGKDTNRPAARTRRRQFFAALTSAGLFAAALLGVDGLNQQAAAQTARPAAAPAQNRYQAPGNQPATSQRVVPAQQVPNNQIAPKPTGAGQPTQTAIRPNPTQLQVMAVVNGEQISQADLGKECLWRFGKEVLEGMVNRQLIAEACQQKKIVITNADIEGEIDRIAGKFGLPRDRWMQLLHEERGYSEGQYKREIVWPMLALRKLSAEQTEVTHDELQKAFDSEFGPKVKALLIVHSQKQLADQLHAAATAKPETFRELSKQHSDDPGVASGYGVIPPIRRHLGDANLEQIAFSLQPGQISPVIQVADKYYILKCEEQIERRIIPPERQAEFEEKLKERIRESKLRGVAAGFFETMAQSAKIVNIYNNPELEKQMPGVVATVNGRPITTQQLTDECLSRYGQEVLEGEISRKVLTQELNKKKMSISQADLDAEVSRAADMYGMTKPDGTPDVDRWLKHVTEQDKAPRELYIRDAVWPSVALKKIVGNTVAITEDDLQKAYESNYGERVEVLAIVLGDQRQAQRVWQMARDNATDSFFANLAGEYSVEPSSRANGGKVPPIQKNSGAPELEKAAFSLQAGGLSGIIAVNDQFIILRCLGRTRPVAVDPQDARKELTKDLQEKKLRMKMSSEFDRLLKTSQIDNYVAGTSQSGREAVNFGGAPGAGRAPQRTSAVAPAGGPGAARAPGGVTPAAGTMSRPVGQSTTR